MMHYRNSDMSDFRGNHEPRQRNNIFSAETRILYGKISFRGRNANETFSAEKTKETLSS